MVEGRENNIFYYYFLILCRNADWAGPCTREKCISCSTTAPVLEGLCPLHQILVVVAEVCTGEARAAWLRSRSPCEHLGHGPGERMQHRRRTDGPTRPASRRVHLSRCNATDPKLKQRSHQSSPEHINLA